MLNMVLTVFHLLFFAFIIAAGLWNGSARNLVRPHGLAPYGVRGVLDGAAIVYFSYIGYDSACTMAEEIRDPSRALPVGIAASVLVVSALYCLMSVALCVMLPYTEVTVHAYAGAAPGRPVARSVPDVLLGSPYVPCVVADIGGRSVLVGVQGEGGVEVGEQRGWRRREHRHRGVAAGGDAGAGQVPVRHRQSASRAAVVRQGPPFHRHSDERHHLSRYTQQDC